MPDYTSEIAELSAAYQANRVANATISHEVRNKYRAIIAAEIDERKRETDKKFADHLAAVKSRANLPVGIIQDHVLHTKAWSRWVYWRDLAGLAPEKVSVGLAREAALRENATFLWSEDYGTLTVKKNSRGQEIEPVIYTMAGLSKSGATWWPTAEDEDHDLAVRRDDEQFAFGKMVSAEIQRQIDAEHIEEPNEGK